MAAASIGTYIEWYDVLLVGILAVTVFPQLYFPTLGPLGVAAGVAAYVSAYFIRPVGAYIFGHLGDRYGRKNTLALTLILVGVATIITGLVPPYESIGYAAPVLVILLRLIVGIGVSGEFAGAVSWIMEFVPGSRYRSLYIAPILVGAPIGQLIAAAAVYFAASLPQFLAYGWRIVTIIGGAAAIVGAVIRYRFLESPMFTQLLEKGDVDKTPALSVLRKFPLSILLLAFYAGYIIMTNIIIGNPYGLSYLRALGPGAPNPYIMLMVASAVGTVATITASLLNDLVGRRIMSIIGTAYAALIIYPYFNLVISRDWLLVMVAWILGPGLGVWLGYGSLGAVYAEHFPTKYRYSGVALTYQVGTVYVGIITVVLIPLLLTPYHNILDAGVAWNSLRYNGPCCIDLLNKGDQGGNYHLKASPLFTGLGVFSCLSVRLSLRGTSY
jgi:MHS family shikimate/dehydroshikimate transporter-like MFS transporter